METTFVRIEMASVQNHQLDAVVWVQVDISKESFKQH